MMVRQVARQFCRMGEGRSPWLGLWTPRKWQKRRRNGRKLTASTRVGLESRNGLSGLS